MATLEELVIQLSADTSELKAAMNSATKVVETSSSKMEDAVKSFAENSSKNTSFFQKTMETMTGFLAADAIKEVLNFAKEGLVFLKDTLMDGVDAASQQQQAMVKLANAMQLAGNYSKASTNELSNFANEMELLTGVNDDAVISNLAYLSSLTKLSSDGLMKAERAAADLASATGIDLNTAVTLVAKGIEGNVGAFKKYGITIEEGSTKTENFNNVITSLQKNFGGAAEGNLKTFSGAVKSVENAFGNLAEAFASAFVNNEAVNAAISTLGKVLNGMASDAEGAGGILKKGIGEALLFIINTLIVGVETVDLFSRTLSASFTALLLPITATAEAISHVVDLLSGNDTGELFAATSENWKQLNEDMSGDNALTKIREGLIDIQANSTVAFKNMGEGAAAVIPTIDSAGKKVVELTALQKAHKEEVKSFVEELVKSSTGITGNYELQASLLQGLRDNQLMTDQTYFDLSRQALLDKQAAEQAAVEEWHATHLSSEAEYQAALSALQQKQVTEKLVQQKKEKDFEELTSKERLANLNQTFGAIASMSQSSNSTLAAIGKAAAISQATMDTYAAANVALKSAPPPWNFALAAAVTAAGVANVAKITGASLATGIDKVPGVGTKDNFPAVLQPGERVVPSKTNQDLSNFLDNQNQGGQNITVNINIPNPIPLNREAAENMVEALNSYFQSGGLRLINT